METAYIQQIQETIPLKRVNRQFGEQEHEDDSHLSILAKVMALKE